MTPITLSHLSEQQDQLQRVVVSVDAPVEALPAGELTNYRDAQQSVVDARRKAVTHEGLLQVS